MYTITTSVQEEGGLTRNVVTRIEGSLSEVWAAHVEDFPRRLTIEKLDSCFAVTLSDKYTLPSSFARGISCCIVAAAYRLVESRHFSDVDYVHAAAILQAQPWVRLYETHGLGFLLGQADKKYHEACGKENKEDAEREFLGAIVYLGMSLLVLEGKVK